MTIALCFNCGHMKFGAICPCPECRIASTGNMNLDIAFSDHWMSVDTIRAFGEVIRAIRRVCDDDPTPVLVVHPVCVCPPPGRVGHQPAARAAGGVRRGANAGQPTACLHRGLAAVQTATGFCR